MIAGIQAEYQSDVGSTKDTTYLALTGELWDVFCEYFWENWPRYNSTTLYFQAKTVDNSGITPNDKRNHHSGPQVLFLPETGLKKNLEPSLLTHWLLWNLT